MNELDISTLLGDLAPLVLGGLFTWNGATKLFLRPGSEPGARSELGRLLGDERRTGTAVRGLGWVEFVLGLCLLVIPTATMPGVGVALLGAGIAGSLAYARLKGPRPSCPCPARSHPAVTWWALVRAGLVAGGGLVATGATSPWWMAGGQQPVAALAVVLAAALLLGVLSGAPRVAGAAAHGGLTGVAASDRSADPVEDQRPVGWS